ncbi:MAG: SPFH domain-containing protein [Pseudobdellovibrio sp.]
MADFDFNSPAFLAKFISKAALAVSAVVILIFIFSSYSVISPGNTGVIFNIWTGTLRTVPQGVAWRFPFVTQVQSYPTALRTYTMVRRSGEGSSSLDDSIDLLTREGQMSLSEVISVKRNELQDNIQKNLLAEREKMAAQQQAEYELQKQQMLAKAEANRLLQSTFSPSLIQSKAIDKWNGVLPQVAGGATPFIDLRGFKSTKE